MKKYVCILEKHFCFPEIQETAKLLKNYKSVVHGLFVQTVLDYLLSNGVITQDEYEDITAVKQIKSATGNCLLLYRKKESMDMYIF